MQGRYSRLFTLSINQYTHGGSVVIEAGALLMDNVNKNVLAQLKIKSISVKQIIAVKIRISCYDIGGQLIGNDVEFQYLDLKVNRDEEFGQNTPIDLPDKTTRSFAVKEITVFFTDGSHWRCDSVVWQTLNINALLDGFYENGELVKQYRLETTIQSKFVPTDAEDIWFCACGRINGQDELRCHYCGADHKQLLSCLDRDFLYSRLEQRSKQERKEKERIALVHNEEKKRRKRRLLKTLCISFCAIALISVISCLFFNFIKPEIKYRKAMQELEQSNFGAAYSLFQEIPEYKDAEILAQKAIENVEIKIENNQWDLSDYEREGQIFSDAYVCEVSSQRKDPLLLYVNYEMNLQEWKQQEFQHRIICKDNILTLINGEGALKEDVSSGDEIISALSLKGYLSLNKVDSADRQVTIEDLTTSKEDFYIWGRNAYYLSAKVKSLVQTGYQLLAFEIVDKNIGIVQTDYCLIVDGTADIFRRFSLSDGAPKPEYEIFPIAIYNFNNAARDSFKYSCSSLEGEINSIGSYEGSITIKSENNQVGLAVFRLEVYDGSTLVNSDKLITTVLFSQGVGIADVYIYEINKTELEYKIDLVAYAPFTALE